MTVLGSAWAIGSSGAPAALAHEGRGGYRPDELVCRMNEGYSIDIVNQMFSTSVKGEQAQTGCYLLRTPPGQNVESLAVAISALPEVAYCGFNYVFSIPEGLQRSQPFLDATNEGDCDTQPAAVALDLETAHTVSVGAGARIALIDGGVDFGHPDFAGFSLVPVWDYVDGDSAPDDVPGGSGYGHGTFVAGTIRLVAPGASLYVYRVLDTAGCGAGYDVASAILEAVDAGCRTINLSLGMIGVDGAVDLALRYARDRQAIVVAAAGNDSTADAQFFPFPASRSNCLAVAALDSADRLADFSNYGVRIDYCAPGTAIYGPFPDSVHAWWSGTSFAAPFVSGLAALVQSVDSTLLRDDVDGFLALTAWNVDSLNPGYEGLLGHGRISPSELHRLSAAQGSGDLNLDGQINTFDVILLVNYVFKAGAAPVPLSSGDVGCDGTITASDIILLARYVFLSGQPPC
jgi:hypothetical protein